jgi:small-conductance mechanosensitive channel
VFIILFYVLIRLVLGAIRKGLRKYSQTHEIDKGRVDAIFQIIRYVVWIVYSLISVQLIGLELTWLMASGAALMVGIGLGLQNVFNDVVSGIIILFEGSVEKGDIITVGEDMIGEVIRINIRTSLILTRNNISVIVPNHKLVEDNIINWSHNAKVPRFMVKVGVAYGSNTKLVKQVLLDVAREIPQIQKDPAPFVRFKDFAESSLDFELFFWSKEIFVIEDVISDLRFRIDEEFRMNGITIPFPQRDVHLIQNKQ